MKMHFITTGTKFPYPYFVGLVSASKVGDVKLWYTKRPKSEYFERVVKMVDNCQVNTPDFPALKGRPEHFNLVSIFDYLIWKVVAEHGGSVMGLDSITLKPFHNLLNGKEMLVGCDAETVSDSYCMHGATAKPGSVMAGLIHNLSTRVLEGHEIDGLHRAYRNGILRFGGAGIIPFLNVVHENMDKVEVAEFGVLGGYLHDGSPFYLYKEETTPLLNPDARTIPFYATWQSKGFKNITPETVKGTLLGKLIKEVGV